MKSPYEKVNPNTLVNQSHNLFEGVRNVSYYGGATLVETYASGWGAITLGSYIMAQRGTNAEPNDWLFQHEYGHYRQSQRWGPIYLFGVGLPSLWSANKANNDPSHIHNNFWAEQNANKRGYEYFMRVTNGTVNWDGRNDILDTDWVNSIQNLYRQTTPTPSTNGTIYNPTSPIRINPTAPNYHISPFFHQGIGFDDEYWRYRRGSNRASNDRLRILLMLYK